MKTFTAIASGFAQLSKGYAFAHGASAFVQQETTMAAPIVFFDIAGPDGVSQRTFYATVFGWRVAEDGALWVETRAPLRGTLRTDPPDSLLYFGVRDVTATLTQITAAGGTVDAPRFEVPGVVVLGLFRDPAGNRMGLVEIDERDEPIVP
jgi:predicted enzyme related to lactoylglutathione lyase